MRAINNRPPWSQSSARVATISLFDMLHLITSVKMASRCTSQISWKNKNLSQSRISGHIKLIVVKIINFCVGALKFKIELTFQFFRKRKKKPRFVATSSYPNLKSEMKSITKRDERRSTIIPIDMYVPDSFPAVEHCRMPSNLLGTAAWKRKKMVQVWANISHHCFI
jgi:hypothetical protein